MQVVRVYRYGEVNEGVKNHYRQILEGIKFMVRRTLRDYIRGVSPYLTKAKKRKVKDRNESICLSCNKETCEKGMCEKFRKKN